MSTNDKSAKKPSVMERLNIPAYVVLVVSFVTFFVLAFIDPEDKILDGNLSSATLILVMITYLIISSNNSKRSRIKREQETKAMRELALQSADLREAINLLLPPLRAQFADEQPENVGNRDAFNTWLRDEWLARQTDRPQAIADAITGKPFKIEASYPSEHKGENAA